MVRVFAIGDLHLSGATNKPMHIFGSKWERHFDRIQQAWRAKISKDDVVLIPGDISWANTPDQAAVYLRAIGELPGKKVLIKGNHDHWWDSISRVRAMLAPGMFSLQNDSLRLGDLVLCGTRGWNCPGREQYSEEADRKYYERELSRLSLSLASVKKRPRDTLIALIHYPPFNDRAEPTGFTRLFESHGADVVVYGHVHARACRNAFEGTVNGVIYHLVSCDHLNFQPRLVAELY
jgi:predicted phosphohydrolase